jgi:hypothetical protein
MAVLSEQARAEVWAGHMRANEQAFNLSKADLRAAVNAIDGWIDSNAAALNAVIPQPARSALTTSQKAQLLTLVVARRYIEGA